MNKSLAIIIAILFLTGCSSTEVEVDNRFYFKKVIYVNDEYIFSQDSLFDNSYQINLISTFVYYGIPLEINSADLIQLDRELLNDMNLLFNITKKSEDEQWLKSHIWNTGRDITKE